MTVKTAFAHNLTKGQNSLKIWSRGNVPADLIRVKVFYSDEAGAISKAVTMPGTLASIARPIGVDNASWSEKGATNDKDIRSLNNPSLVAPEVVDPSGTLTIGNTVDGDYSRMTAGDLDFYQFIAGAHRAVKSLKNIASGVAESGVWTALPGYWPKTPTIVPTLNRITSFDVGYVNQSQSIRVEVTDIESTSAGRYRFKGNTIVETDDGSTYEAAALSATTNTMETVTGIKTLPLNTRQVTSSLSFNGYASVTHPGGDGHHVYIFVQVRIEYLTNGIWVYGPWSPEFQVHGGSWWGTSMSTPTVAQDITHIRARVQATRYDFWSVWQIYQYTVPWKTAIILNDVQCSLVGGSVITTGTFNYLAIA